MRTKLEHYCTEFQRSFDPLLEPLDAAHAALDRATAGTPGRELLSLLTEVRHDARTLGEKVKGQQAYVLIFGPLKSGKSTLMNAIAAAYVSEVSSLPAYPCLVFVGPGPRREYIVTRYDGSSQTFTQPEALARAIDEAHGVLATAIRSAEQKNLAFDPQEHLPTALRRVDVRLPASELQATGAVLVDTPGLYTRMRFGYDRMTRDFRDAAACAIFVVKSDTLFLEQVFAEFHELLDLWSRIFLIVNVDSQKRDIGPDGALVPSVEQSRPQAIVQAFEQLAMSAPLHRAAADGRVRLYPVDLLRAAAAVLRKPPAPVPDDFARFQHDLSEFLGSDEYLAAFLRDSLRRAHGIAAELAGGLDGPAMSGLAERVAELRQQVEYTQAELDLLQRAQTLDYAAAFGHVERQLNEEIVRSARDEGQKLLRSLGASIDTWFLSGHALHWLLHDHWQPLLRDYRREVERAGTRALEQSLQQSSAGLELPAAVLDLCERRRIDLPRLRQDALASLGDPVARADAPVPVDVAAIPLKKGLLDFVAFRSVDQVRARLFGDPQRPDAKITARDKAARLGEPGRLFLHQCVTQLRTTFVPATAELLQRHFGAALQQATITALRERLAAEQAPLRTQLERLQREIERLQQVAQPLQNLGVALATTRQRLPALAAAFGQEIADFDANPRVVLQPAPRGQRSTGTRSPSGGRSPSADRS